MKDVSFVVEADDSELLARKTSRFPLRAKAIIALFFTLLPLALLSVFVAYPWTSPGLSGMVTQIQTGGLQLYSYYLPAYLVLIIAAAFVGFGIGYVALEHSVIEPLHRLVAWLKQARSTAFARVPVLPRLHRDEIGELGRLISSSTAYFSETKQQNSTLIDEKSLFMTVAAHQLRTPLTGLLWGIESLLSPETPADSRHQIMTDVDGLLKRMRLIVNHILASANVEDGKYGYVFEKIDIIPVIDKLVTEFKPVSDYRGVAMAFEHDVAAFPVYADGERIALALFDLISNAIDYTPRGGTITVSAVPQGERLEIAVADTGIGISETEILSLFTKFYRSDRARHMRPDGTGLGLFLVKNIITSHHSEIKVASKEGSGSRFSFSLDSTKKPSA